MPLELGQPTAPAPTQSGKPGDTAQTPGPNQAQQANAAAGNPAGAPPTGATPAAPPTAMGTQFVPASPEATAKLMAGPSPLAQEALQAALAEMQNQAAQPGQPQPGQPQPSQQGAPGQAQQPKPGTVTSASTKGGTPESGSPMENGPVQDGPPDTADDGKKPSDKTASTGASSHCRGKSQGLPGRSLVRQTAAPIASGHPRPIATPTASRLRRTSETVFRERRVRTKHNDE